MLSANKGVIMNCPNCGAEEGSVGAWTKRGVFLFQEEIEEMNELERFMKFGELSVDIHVVALVDDECCQYCEFGFAPI